MLPTADLIRPSHPLPRAEAIRGLPRTPGEDFAAALEVKSQLAYQTKHVNDLPPTLVIDLDGTLTVPHPHWPKVEMGEVEVRPDAPTAVQSLHAQGWRIVIFTAHEELDEVADWLDEHDIPHDFLNENPDPDSDSPKPEGRYYIDDRAINAQKPWSEIVAEITASSPLPKPDQKHIILTGHSGAGKSTLARVLGEKLGLPVWKVDQDPLWKKNEALADHPDRYDRSTKEGKRFRKLLKKLVRRAVEKRDPHILEGCQFLVATGSLRGHEVIVCDGDRDTIAAQRLKRDAGDGKLERDGPEKRLQKAYDLYDKLVPEVERLKSRPGVVAIKSTEMERFARRRVYEQVMHRLTQEGADVEEAKLAAQQAAAFTLFPPSQSIAAGPHGEYGTKAAMASNAERAKAADLIRLPEGVEGTNCGNCKFINNGFCEHPKVQLQVDKRDCCAFWDADGAVRLWHELSDSKALSAMSETSGGALVAPAQQGGTPVRRRCLKCQHFLKKTAEQGWHCPNPSCAWSLFAAGDTDVKELRRLYRSAFLQP